MTVQRRGTDEMAVVGLGLCTPLGLTARTTQAEMAAGTVRFFETEVLDNAGEPVRASVLPLLERSLTRTERMTALAVTALQEAMKDAASLRLERLPLLLALPESESGAPFETSLLLEALRVGTSSVRLEISESSLFPEGRAGFFHALSEASRILKSRKAPWILVGGVDSMCDRDSLAHHTRTGRSLGLNTRDGCLPGEGAGFLLLTSSFPRAQSELSPRGWIMGCALSCEPHSFLQRKPNLAEGLTHAFHQLRTHPATGDRRVDHVLSCQTGETFWAQEFNLAYLRNAPLMPEPLVVSLVAESLGDVGAAAGPIQLGCALHRLAKLASPHEEAARALIYGCSDAGHVGACILGGRE